ncbi:PH domain-containing protein [Pseudarthrobacter sp. B907]|uniref:PH domain-containing protein n=1 Tax=Pseudarthrobacter sp. B907 TaxID=3158261 RepID=UPI0032DA7EF1
MGKTTTPLDSAPQARTFKDPSGRAVSLVVWAGCAVAVGWLLLAGRTGAAAAAAPWLAVLSLLVYLTQWRPRLIVDGDGFEVVNGLRRHRIPFAAVDDIEVRHAVTLTAGRISTSAGVLRLRPVPSPQASSTPGTGSSAPSDCCRPTSG